MKIYPKKYKGMVCSKCQKEMSVRVDYVRKHSGICMSCQKKGNKNALKHGDTNTRLYKIWKGLFYRRYKVNPNVCKAWHYYHAFKNWSLCNGYTEQLTIDRIDNNGDYEPSNCQWITLQENAGKDKIIYSNQEKLSITKERKELNMTQVEFAKFKKVSKNTIQRAEKYSREVNNGHSK